MHIKFLFEIIKLIKTFNLDPLILQDFDQRKIDFLSDQTNICISNFVQINDFLPNYFKAEYTHTKEKYRETIKSLLEEIKNNQGYHVFLKMFNIEAVNKENEKVIPECIEVIEILNESNYKLNFHGKLRYIFNTKMKLKTFIRVIHYLIMI